MASSPTLFPEAYVLEFQKCLDKADPVPWNIIQQTIQEELTQPIDAVFSSISQTPLATASVAQVHCAVLRESQKEVVLKVLKPAVEDILTTDLNFLLLSTKLLEVLNPELARASLVGIVSDIRSSMLDEVDFRKETQHIQQFSAYLDRTNMRQGATCPFVYKQLSSKRYVMPALCLSNMTLPNSCTACSQHALSWIASHLHACGPPTWHLQASSHACCSS